MEGDVPPSHYLCQYKLVEDATWTDGMTVDHDDTSSTTYINQTKLMPNTRYVFRVITVYTDQDGINYKGKPSMQSQPVLTGIV